MAINPRTHIIRVSYNTNNRFEAKCSCQWAAVTMTESRLEWFTMGHKGYWEMLGETAQVEGQDGRGFVESLRAAIQAAAPHAEPAPAPDARPGPEVITKIELPFSPKDVRTGKARR